MPSWHLGKFSGEAVIFHGKTFGAVSGWVKFLLERAIFGGLIVNFHGECAGECAGIVLGGCPDPHKIQR